MANIEATINWFKSREGKVRYSMSNRLGPTRYDCSSAIIFALIEGGFLPKGTMGNTETLYNMEGSLLQPIQRSQVKRGDMFIAGIKKASNNAAGHTGIFLSNNRIIHCNAGTNGISETPANGYMGDASGLPVHFYRIKGVNDGLLEKTNKGEEDMTEFAILYGTGVFYVCGTKMKLLTGVEWEVLRAVYNQVTEHKTGKGQDIKVMDWRNNQATFDAYVKICGGYSS